MDTIKIYRKQMADFFSPHNQGKYISSKRLGNITMIHEEEPS
jgi:hypothetical protein